MGKVNILKTFTSDVGVALWIGRWTEVTEIVSSSPPGDTTSLLNRQTDKPSAGLGCFTQP